MLPHSDFFLDKNGVYKREWSEKIQNSFNKKFPFRYTMPVSAKNTFITRDSRYIVYNFQAYDPWDNKLYKHITAGELALLKSGKGYNIEYRLKQDSLRRLHYVSIDGYVYKKDGKIIYLGKEYAGIDTATFKAINYWCYKDKRNVYNRTLNVLELIPGADPESFTIFNGFEKDKNKLYLGDGKVLNAANIELLATFIGYRRGCGLDKTRPSDYFLFKNIEGYWLVLSSATVDVKYLGAVFNPKWGPAFEKLELARL
jgi:hypothetical protein